MFPRMEPVKGRLDDVVQPFAQRRERDNQFGRIPQRGIKQSPEPRADTRRELLGRGSQHPGQGNDAHGRHKKYPCRIGMNDLEEHGDGHENQQHVEP